MSSPSRLSPVAIGLVVSLVLNALLVGLIAGNMMGAPKSERHSGAHRGGGGGSDFEIARGIEAVVPDTDREGIRRALRQTTYNHQGYRQGA